MKKIFFTLGAILACCYSFAQQDLIIKDVNILSMTGEALQKKKSLKIQDGKIVQIANFKEIKRTSHTEVLHAKGKYLLPGLAEMHTHLPEAQSVDTFLIANVAAGVTHLRVMNTAMPQMDLKARIAKENMISPTMHYTYLVRKEMNFSEAQFDSIMQIVKADGRAFVKMFSIADETTFDNLMRSANKHQVRVCGHYPAMIAMEKVLNSGFLGIEHLAGYEKIKDEAELDKVIALTQAKGVYNCPTLDWDIMGYDLQYPDAYKKRLVYANAPARYLQYWDTLYTNSIQRAGEEKVLAARDKYLPHFQYKEKILKKMNDQGCLLLLGGDPGNTFQMHGFNLFEEMNNWSKAGIPNIDILRAATVNPAKFFGESSEWGTIEVGKNADLILLEKNPLEDIQDMKTIFATFVKGKLYYKKALLEKI